MNRPFVIVGLCALASLVLVVAPMSQRAGGVVGFLTSLDRPELPLFADYLFHYQLGAATLLSEGRPAAGYYYPASFALFLVPLTWLPPEAALRLWAVLQGLAMLALLVLVGLALWPEGRRWALGAVALTAVSHPLWHNLRWGQVSVPVTALILGALVVPRARGRSGPFWLALATSIKALPVLFALPWIARRDGRCLLRYGIAALALGVLLPMLAMGPERFWGFTLDTRRAAASAIETWVPDAPSSQYLPHVVSHWVGTAVAPVPLRWLATLLCVANLALAFALARRRPPRTSW